MLANSNLKELILDSVRRAQVQSIGHLNLYTNNQLADKENEFLFFLKPEITLASPTIRLDAILEMVFEKIKSFGLFIGNVNIIGAEYLDEYKIMSQHYGVINQRAIDASRVQAFIGEPERASFYKSFNENVDDVSFIGGIDLLSKNPSLTPNLLETLWEQSKPQEKLAPGTYCRKLYIGENKYYVINGFHPNQLLHFTANGRSIVTMSLSGDLAWETARNGFVGATNPEKAQEGSLRRLLLENIASFGLSTVSQGLNGIHLSAGPVEGLVELVRFNSDFSIPEKIKHYSDFAFGKKLAKVFDGDAIEAILANKQITVNAKASSVFDLTEEANSSQAIVRLQQVFKQIGEDALG